MNRRLLSTAVLALAPASALLAAALLHGQVPDPVPTHWNLRGEVDGTTGFVVFTAIVLALTSALAVAATVVTWLATTRAVAAATGLLGWLAWLFALLYVATLVAAEGAPRAESVHLPWWLPVTVLAGPGAAWLALHALLPPHGRSSARPVPAMALAADERVVWVGSARSRVLAWSGFGITVAGAVLVPFAPVVGALAMPIGVLMWWLHVLTVRVDHRGVRAGWGPARWPGRSIALQDVAAAEAETIEPMQWGGWGHRISPRGTAMVVRRGPGLVLHRRAGNDLAVTVDDPDDAAALLNALVQRAATRSDA